MRVAMSGSSGLVGTALNELLCSRSDEVLKLQRPANRNSPVSVSSAEESRTRETQANSSQVSWEPTMGVADPQQLEGLDAIIHLAGRSINAKRWSRAEKARLRDSRVLATEKLVQQIANLKVKPKVFLSASAIGVYGSSGDRIVDENSPAGDDFLAKLAIDWERASQPLTDLGVRVVHARFGVILSRSGGALAKMLPLFRWGIAGVLGPGTQYMSWVSLHDCCRALIHILENTSLCGPVNIVSPNAITNRQFTKTLGGVLHRPTFLPVPGFALRTVLGEMADGLLLSSCRVQPVQLIQSGFQFDDETLEQALRREV